ncbi:MAG: thiamine pyrophosphokinase [Mucilaginibacter sp.]
MSSHHIVREKQEPALLIFDLDNFDSELLGQLLEWSPTVIVTQPMAEKLNSYGIKIDWIIAGDNKEEIQSDVKVIPGNNKAPLLSALKFLTDNNYPAVNIIIDTLNLDYYHPFIDKINLVIFYNGQKIYPVTSGFSKWKPAGEILKILSDDATIKVSGLTPLTGHNYKTTNDGFFTILLNQPYTFIAEGL